MLPTISSNTELTLPSASLNTSGRASENREQLWHSQMNNRSLYKRREVPRSLVTAGPGTGKTHVLIHRLANLISDQEMAPGELLVLSFSRAAVKEIRDRLRKFGGNAGYIRASTFDSFATRILALSEPEGNWQTENYDDRIRHATKLIRSNEDARAEATSYRHIVVDEIQDLVSDRAELVKALLEDCTGGFSLFGDPAQGIYSYQLEGHARMIGSASLYCWLRDRFESEITERCLQFNFRVASDEARIALWAGPELNLTEPDYTSIRYRLETDVLRLRTAGDVSLALPLLRETAHTTAILCRDNGQALTISGQLYDAAVGHRLQARATDRRIAPWVAIALRDLDGNLIGKRQFLEVMEAKTAEDLPTPIEMWQCFKRIERLRYPSNLDLDLVNERLRSGEIPDELTEAEPANLVVSTIHRAKGLEFQRVLVVEPSLKSDDPVEVAEETRLLYVALTRAQSENWHLKPPNTKFLWPRDDLDRRWVRGGPQKWMRSALEVRGDDVHKSEPAGMFILRESAIAVQDYLRVHVGLGDQVVLTRREAFVEGEPRTFYVIEHRGNPVGVTSMSFGGIMFSALRVNAHWNVKWPCRIEGLHVEGVDTVAGLPTIGRQAGLGGCGTWLRVRISGLGRFMFESQETS